MPGEARVLMSQSGDGRFVSFVGHRHPFPLGGYPLQPRRALLGDGLL